MQYLNIVSAYSFCNFVVQSCFENIVGVAKFAVLCTMCGVVAVQIRFSTDSRLLTLSTVISNDVTINESIW